MPRIDVGKLTLFCDVQGRGTPVLLIPGLSGSHLGWTTTQVPALVAAGYQCISLDNRDVGTSDRSPVAHYSVRDMADDTAHLLRTLGVGPAHVVGWSMGGMIAQELALSNPALMRSMTLACSDAGQSPLLHAWLDGCMMLRPRCTLEEFARVTIPWLFAPKFLAQAGAQEAFLQAVRDDPAPQDAPAYIRQCLALLQHDAMSRLSGIDVPSLVIAGEQDLLSPMERVRTMAARIPNCELSVMPEVGHAACWEDAPRFNATLMEFWRRAES